MSELTEYLRTYKALTSRQNSGDEILAWITAEVPAAEAAAWANLNYYPGECADLRAQGVTPAMAEAMEDAETDVAGGPEALAMQRVDDLLRRPDFADPAQVRRIPPDA